MSPRSRLLPLVCFTLLLTIGCGGEPPEKEMQQAQGALDAAKAAGAEIYATDEYTAAQQALANARDAVTQRDYRLALDRALDSRERAQEAARQAADGKAAARVDADRALSAAQKAIDDATEKLEAAEARKVAARQLQGPRKSIEAARNDLQEARALFEQGEYKQVPARATAATASLPAALAQLEAAPAPPPRRRR
jgi:hypothetical protein